MPVQEEEEETPRFLLTSKINISMLAREEKDERVRRLYEKDARISIPEALDKRMNPYLRTK